MSRMSPAVKDLLLNLTDDNPPPEEKWFSEDYFDPKWKRVTLVAAERDGRIEINRDNGFDGPWRFRPTAKGRADFAAR